MPKSTIISERKKERGQFIIKRSQLFTSRKSAQQILQKLVEQAEKLKPKYIEAKKKTPNKSRINGIDKILEVIDLIKENIKSNSLSIEHTTGTPINDDLESHIELYQNSINKLKGAILNLEQKIKGQYDSSFFSAFSSIKHSELYTLLCQIVNPVEMAKDQTAMKTCIDTYKLLLEEKPKQDVDVKVKEPITADKSSTPNDQEDITRASL